MSVFTKTANDTFAPHDAAGNARSVNNQDAQVWGTEVERLFLSFQAGGGILFASKAAADATLTYAANQQAWVMGDAIVANNGVYRKVGASGTGSWVRVGDLPYSFITAADAGAGTANAIQATTSIPVSGSALILLNIFEANTSSPVTVSFNGGTALTIKTNAGNNIAAGGLVAGMIVTGIISGSMFRLVSDQASAAIVAAAEAAQSAAEAAAAEAESWAFYTPDLPGVLPRPVIAKIKEGPISLQDAGYVSGNALAAFNKALASGHPIILGPETYEIDGLLDVVTNTPVNIQGYGFGATFLKFIDGTPGLRISQDSYIYPTNIKDVLLTTTHQEPGAALAVTYSAADSINNRNLPRCNLIDVSAYGHDIYSHGWSKGIVMTDVHRPCIVRPVVTGRRNLPAGGLAQFLNMEVGIEIIGSYPPTLSADPSDILIENPRLDQMYNGIRASGEAEGLIINSPVLVAVATGVFASYETIRPWVKVAGGHMNVFSFGVNLKNAPHSTVSDMLIYKFQNATGDTYAVNMDTCEESSVKNCTLYNLAGGSGSAGANGQWHGVNVLNSAGVTIDDIRHVYPSKTVMLGGTTTGTKTSNLRTRSSYSGATVQTYDDASSGTNEYSGGNKPIANVTNASNVAVTASPAAVTATASINVNKGERYHVEGFINATKGPTAGDFLTQLAKTGTATAVFGANRSTLLERSAQAVTSTIAHCVSGILTVTASGTLTFQLVGTSTGSNSDVLAGDAQLSIVLL